MSDSDSNSRRWRSEVFLQVGLLAVLVLAVFLPVVGFQFMHYDDDLYVLNNLPVRNGLSAAGVKWAFTSIHGGYWAPLLWLSYMLDASLFGTRAGGYLAVNLALHLANVLLLFALLRRLTGRGWCSLAAAAIWAVHPINTGTVAWVACRKDVLFLCFGLLCLHAYFSFVRSRAKGWYALALAGFLAGLMVKPMLVVLPGVMLLLNLWPAARWSWPKAPLAAWWRQARSPVLEVVPFGLVAIGFGVLTTMTQHRDGALQSLATVSIGSRAATMLAGYTGYLRRLVWFGEMSIHYPRVEAPVGQLAVGAAVIVAVTLAAAWQGWRRPYLLCGWLWFLGCLLPVSGIMQSGPQQLADRFAYLPLIGLTMAFAWLASRAGRTWPLVALMTVIVITLAVSTRFQLQYWQNPIAAFSRQIDCHPRDSLGYLKLGDAYLRQNSREALRAAVDAYTKGAEMAPCALLYNNCGVAQASLQQYPEAEKSFREAIRIDRKLADAHNNLGNALWSQGRREAAVDAFRQAQILDPHGPAAANLARLRKEEKGEAP